MMGHQPAGPVPLGERDQLLDAPRGSTLLIFAAQVQLSVLWLRHFRYGPLEWLWRSLTYGQRQPMRIRERPVVVGVAS